MDPLSILVIFLCFAAIVLVPTAAILQRRKDKAPASLARVEVAPPLDEPRCPCGARATKPLPRHKVYELPVVGRVVVRQRDAFAELVVCEAHADVADTVIDERIAQARLADAQAQRDKITQLANGGDVLGAVAASLPEPQRKAYERRRLPAAPVRVLKAVNGEDGEGQG